jgi:hypothetical protein
MKRSKELQNALKDMAEIIGRIPAIYETDGDNEAKCALHYFDSNGSADWYVFEIDAETGEAFGFAALSGDIADPCAEFGYIALDNLCKMARINLDLYFDGITKAEIIQRKYGKAV